MKRAFASDSAAAVADSAAAAAGARLDSLLALDRLAAAAMADTSRARFDGGAGMDVTNEQFYEDLFDSSLVARRIGQQLVSTPETRHTALLDVALTGTRDGRRTRYDLRPSLSLGDLLQRVAFEGTWRQELGVWNELVLAPSLELRHDRTFDRDMQESRAGLQARLRRTLPDAITVLETGAGGEWLHAGGAGAEYLPSRNAGFVSGALERDALEGAEWRAEYQFRVRTFPDSSVRNHLEHGWDARWHRDLTRGWAVVLDGDGERRGTLAQAPNSRDNYWRSRTGAELAREGLGGWRARVRGEVEAMRYDREDSTVFENDTATRGLLLLGYSPRAASWTWWAGPRAEIESSDDPAESYRELAGHVEVERLAPGTWWTVTPEAGWRAYATHAGPAANAISALHSSYAFADLGVIGDQRLAAGVRMRLFATGRIERHQDSSQNSRSLYISCELRRLF